MAKFYGVIGYVISQETSPGVWEEVPIEKPYYGDIVRNSRRWEPVPNNVNDNIKVNVSISVIADDYVIDHLAFIRYVKWMGVAWKINDIDVEFPRITLSIGDVYNGLQA